MVSAKHYLDFELKEPSIDAMVGVASDEEIIDENKIGKDEILAGKITKALKAMANKDASDQSNLKQARTALNKGNIDAAEKIAKPYMEEGLYKKTSYKAKILDIVKQKNLQKGDKVKWISNSPGEKDKTSVEHTGTFIMWVLKLTDGSTRQYTLKYLPSTVAIVAMIQEDNSLSKKNLFLSYHFDNNIIKQDQDAFETLEKIAKQ
jgi:hypothetical protein